MDFMPESLRDGQKFAALLDWYQAPLAAAEYEPLLGAYEALDEVRAAFTKAYEDAQAAGVVTEKTAQAARAVVTLPAETLAAFEAAGVDGAALAEVFVCSEVEVAQGDELAVAVEAAHGEKCPRCWNWRELGEDGLCHRCHDVMTDLEAQE
jgi:isoleucyl-tRNA synthetase